MIKYTGTIIDNVIMAKGIAYTGFVGNNEIELTKEQYDTIPIPCKLVDGDFVPCDLPTVDGEETSTQG